MESARSPQSLDGWLSALSSSRPVPAVGAATALSAAMAASVVAKVARRSQSYLDDSSRHVCRAEHLRDSLLGLADEDGPLFREAMKRSRANAPNAMAVASAVPWRIAVLSAETCGFALELGTFGNRNLVHDAFGAATIACSCARVAADLVRANLDDGPAVATSAAAARHAAAALARFQAR